MITTEEFFNFYDKNEVPTDIRKCFKKLDIEFQHAKNAEENATWLKAIWNLRQEHKDKIELLDNLIVLLKNSYVRSFKEESSKDLFNALFAQAKLSYQLEITERDSQFRTPSKFKINEITNLQKRDDTNE